MQVISMIDRKIKGFPMWSKKTYKVLKTEQTINRTIVLLMDDTGRKHWMPIGSNFMIK